MVEAGWKSDFRLYSTRGKVKRPPTGFPTTPRETSGARRSEELLRLATGRTWRAIGEKEHTQRTKPKLPETGAGEPQDEVKLDPDEGQSRIRILGDAKLHRTAGRRGL